MQVQETLTDGLKREFQVVVPAAELDAKVDTRLADIKDRVQIRGFRPGKVPVAHLKQVYGRSVMAETIDATVQETNAKIVEVRQRLPRRHGAEGHAPDREGPRSRR